MVIPCWNYHIKDKMNEVIVLGKKLKKTYVLSKEERIQSVDGIDIEIRKGEFVVIMGDSGSGKSTLLYLLCGLETITEGEICLGLEKINDMSEDELAVYRRKNIGFVFQSINLIPNMTLLENIVLPGLLTGDSYKVVASRAKELLKKLNLEDQADKLPAQMSGGQQQRGAIVRALINSPDIIFADEPTGALNSSNSKAVIETIKQLNESGQTVIMVTHDHKMAAYGERVLYIRDGKILSEKKNDKKLSIPEREKQLATWLNEKGW